jgi:hypothetical protein
MREVLAVMASERRIMEQVAETCEAGNYPKDYAQARRREARALHQVVEHLAECVEIMEAIP